MSERVKSYILAFLIITCLVQVGILWNYQYHGLPISFFPGIFFQGVKTAEDDDKTILEKYLVPVVLSASAASSGGAHWVIPHDSELYEQVWRESTLYIAASISSKPVSIDNAGSWGDIAKKKGFMLDFKMPMSKDLLVFALGIEGIPADFPQQVEKIKIVTEKAGSVTLVYLNGSKIYKYNVAALQDALTAEETDRIFERLSQDEKNKPYSIIAELNPDLLPFFIWPDILVSIKGDSYRPYGTLYYATPDILQDTEAFSMAILGGEKDSYDRSVYNSNTVFTGGANIYRVDTEGVLEYQYIQGGDTERGDIGDAFLNACRFIERMKDGLVPGSSLYLSEIDMTQPGYYRFIYEYRIEDGLLPIILNYASAGRGGAPLNNAAVVEANAKRVLKCRWLLRIYSIEKDNKKYDIKLQNLLDRLAIIYSNINPRELDIQDMFPAYPAETSSTALIQPKWIIVRSDGMYYAVDMAVKEGE